MKKTALSLFHSLLCIISATAQAPGALIELSDSIVFEERQGYLFKNGRGICAFDAAEGLIRHYDTELVLLYTVTIDTAYLAKERGNFHNAIVYETGDKIVLLNTTKYKLDLFNKSGKYLYSKKLALKYKGQRYFINNNFPPYDPVTSGNTLLLALKQEWEGYDGSNAEFLKGGQKRYEQSGIIGEVDMDGKLLNVFGRYDTAYRRGRLLTYLDGYSFGWIGSDSVFVSFQ
ncbi:MAG: hypothetical protein KDC70_17180, partial [Saprospiraceae bacterium]|nr:hypothetical protein [Saprospiraceae bacterium]